MKDSARSGRLDSNHDPLTPSEENDATYGAKRRDFKGRSRPLLGNNDESGGALPRAAAASEPVDADAAIRLAAKLAIDAGDLERARALLDLLAPKQAATVASVTPLAVLRSKVGRP